MKCKTFNYKKYKNCSFEVGNYINNSACMSIQILDNKKELKYTCTVNMPDYMYYPETATIKNYSNNTGMTKFLQKLGVIEEIYSSRKANPYAEKSETIDYCLINVEVLKEYSSSFNYEWKI